MSLKYKKDTRRDLTVCFVAPKAYSLLSKNKSNYIIGPAIHQYLLSNRIRSENLKQVFITYDEGGPPIEEVNDITVIKTFGENERFGLLKKAYKIWKSLKLADADVYYHQGGVSGVVAIFCKLKRKRFVLGIGSDAHVNRSIVNFGIVDRVGSWLDIKLSDNIIVQTEYQGSLLKENFGKDGRLIKNHIPIKDSGAHKTNDPPLIIWVGSMASVKQPEMFLEVAKAIPEAVFEMIGGYSSSDRSQIETFTKITTESKCLSNFRYVGPVPFDRIDSFYERASILVNTSKLEGFPYAFLQAWLNHVPVVSLNADPDELICKNNLGFHSKSYARLVEDIKSLLANDALRQEMGKNCRMYVVKEHDIDKIYKQYLDVFCG